MRPRLSGVDEAVVAVIATYRPSPNVADLVRVVRNMVDRVVVADDASPCTYDKTLRDLSSITDVQVRGFRDNQGIARSLNVGLQVANEIGTGWLLTLDQDTQLPDSYVDTLMTDAVQAQHEGIPVGVIAPREIHDRAGKITYPEKSTQGWLSTAEILQSGALWSADALNQIGGFDEDFGMDAVDAAACLALRERGYAVLLCIKCTFSHEWGNGSRIKILGRSVAVTGHSPARRTSIIRNRLRLAPREFRQSPAQGFRSLRRLVVGTGLALTVETDRRENFRAALRGLNLRDRSKKRQ